LANEKHHAAKLDVVFDVNQLCRLVAELPAVGSPVTQIEKSEGGFNMALRLTAENGAEVFAKIPCPNVVPAAYVTASEVAVMEYGKHFYMPFLCQA
jgi:hypothetical protein